MPDKNWQFELEEYIKQGEPDRAEKSEAWQTAIGLQAVDGLNTSEYLLDTAKDHIEGKITIDEAQKRIHSYYEQRTTRTETENETKEADIVSARITKLLGEKAFQFSPAEWITIHRRLFEGVFDHAGQIRQKIRSSVLSNKRPLCCLAYHFFITLFSFQGSIFQLLLQPDLKICLMPGLQIQRQLLFLYLVHRTRYDHTSRYTLGVICWWARVGSNHRPYDYQSYALAS